MTGCSINEVLWYKWGSSGMSKTGEGRGGDVSLTADFPHHLQLSLSVFQLPLLLSFVSPDAWSSMFICPMVRWFLASDRENEIVDTSIWEFVASACATVLRDLMIQKAPNINAAPFVSGRLSKGSPCCTQRPQPRKGKWNEKYFIIIYLYHNSYPLCVHIGHSTLLFPPYDTGLFTANQQTREPVVSQAKDFTPGQKKSFSTDLWAAIDDTLLLTQTNGTASGCK